jgi:hypothetical protein
MAIFRIIKALLRCAFLWYVGALPRCPPTQLVRIRAERWRFSPRIGRSRASSLWLLVLVDQPSESGRLADELGGSLARGVRHDIRAPEREHAVDAEEVRSQQRGGVGSQESAPGLVALCWRRNAVSAQVPSTFRATCTGTSMTICDYATSSVAGRAA